MGDVRGVGLEQPVASWFHAFGENEEGSMIVDSNEGWDGLCDGRGDLLRSSIGICNTVCP